MAQQDFTATENPAAQRQPKTDRLFLGRFVRDAGDDKRIVEVEPWQKAHAVLLRWVD